MQVILRDVSLILCVQMPERHVQLYGAFINDSLAYKLNRDFAFDEASQESFQ